ncbi:hypothetical protein BpHYR1_005705, partial [Brachionus plicatilis]
HKIKRILNLRKFGFNFIFGPIIKKENFVKFDIERSEVLRMEFLFILICSCQEHELIIKSRCELNA